MEMSNLWFNIRFGTYHWQWGPEGMTFRENDYWVKIKRDYQLNYKKFEVYTLFGKHL